LLYSLRNHGIVRSISTNDYGVDLEYEFVHNNQVSGKIIKIQLKGKKSVKVNRKNQITISKLKQSTLNYWAELSFSSNVFVVIVDISTENIYVSKPIFWEAVALIDNTNKKKSIKVYSYKEASIISPVTNR